jgi:hypothetical protein
MPLQPPPCTTRHVVTDGDGGAIAETSFAMVHNSPIGNRRAHQSPLSARLGMPGARRAVDGTGTAAVRPLTGSCAGGRNRTRTPVGPVLARAERCCPCALTWVNARVGVRGVLPSYGLW